MTEAVYVFTEFQYRKRYEITCDLRRMSEVPEGNRVSIPQAV